MSSSKQSRVSEETDEVRAAGAAEAAYPEMTLEFRTVSDLAAFLLATQEEEELRPGSIIFEEQLNHLFLRKPQTFYVRIQCRRELVKRLIEMAESCRGRAHPGNEVPTEAAELDIQRLLRLLRLKPARLSSRPGSLLLVLWNTDSDGLCNFTADLWNMGASGLELAFMQRSGMASSPSHLIRVQSIRHLDALRSWQAMNPRTLEIYYRMGRGVSETEHWVLSGYQFPVASIERLTRLSSGLVLIRPNMTAEGVESGPAEWRVFKNEDLTFFRKPHDVLDLEVARDERPLIEVSARSAEAAIPLELALVPKPQAAVRQSRQIDQEIDRVRQSLRELEQSRAKLVGRDRDEVYFAYRFNQHGHDQLNPLLARLLQQRLGTLSHYDYAFCQQHNGAEYHLVIADQPSRSTGFAMQMADRIYYQPKQWRAWGVNLYLPIEAEIAPLIDSKDAMPLLQRILDQSSQTPDDEGRLGNFREWCAIVWEMKSNGRIEETRIKEKVPLLQQFRLLNSFQCQVAKDVATRTRAKLAEALNRKRQEVHDDLVETERQLLEHICAKTREIEEKFDAMQQRLTTAERLVQTLQPQIDRVSGRLNEAPQNWVEFVRQVIQTHRELSAPALAEFIQLRNAVIKVETALLRTLTPRGRDLLSAARQELENLHTRLREFDELRSGLQRSLEELEQLGTRVEAVVIEVRRTHGQLQDRIQRMRDSEAEIVTKQGEIDRIQEDEQTIATNLESVRSRRADLAVVEAENARRKGEVEILEAQVIQQTATMGQLKVELERRGLQASERLKALAVQVSKVREQSDAMDRLSRELHEQIGYLDRHSEAVRMWEMRREAWERSLLTTSNELAGTVSKMEHLLSQTKMRSAELDDLANDVRSISARVATLTKQGHGHGQA